jgi:hypothetical protein
MLRDGFLRFCDDPEIACCRAEKELEQLRTENVRLQAELNELQELAKAKAEGQRVELPCKVGDAVYWFWTDGEGNPEGDIEEETVLYFYIDKDGVGIATRHYDGHIGHYAKDGELVDGVRRVFLAREAAEKAIAEVGE